MPNIVSELSGMGKSQVVALFDLDTYKNITVTEDAEKVPANKDFFVFLDSKSASVVFVKDFDDKNIMYILRDLIVFLYNCKKEEVRFTSVPIFNLQDDEDEDPADWWKNK